MRILKRAATAQAVSLTILLTNLFALHLKTVTGVAGTVHGLAYVTVIATAWLAQTAPGVRRRALIPGLGGLLALRHLRGAQDG